VGRATEKILAAALLLVRALTVLVALAVVGGAVWLFWPAHNTRDLRVAYESPAPPGPPTDPDPPQAEAKARTPLPPLKVEGTTRLVCRFEVGDEITRLNNDVEREGAEAARFAERYARVRPFLLEADGAPAAPRDPVGVLCQLSVPHRDLAHMTLAGGAKDPLGRKLLLRVWTTGAPYPGEELRRVSATIDTIESGSGRHVPGGIDVLVTPGMGSDVFPLQASIPWAAGIFYPRDAYCVVRSTTRDRSEVVEHECIHALCWSIPSFSSSRFVAEGLAEYLRLVEPGDRSLDVPRGRFADSCAALDRMLRRLDAAGASTRMIDPPRLVDLPPQLFYALRDFSYLVAQLTMAYVGGEPIERAFANGSDAPIVAAVRDIQWPDFLAFVRGCGRDGHAQRAVIVGDGVPDGKERPSRDSVGIEEALRAIGAGTEGLKLDPALLRAGDAGALGTEEQVVRALKALWESAHERRCCFLGANVSWDRTIQVRTLPDVIVKELQGAPEGVTPRSFARSFLNLMLKREPSHVVAWADERGESIAPLQGLVTRDPAMNLVVLVDTGGAPVALQLVWPTDSPPPVVLVVDLSEDGEGVDVALGYDRPESLVAYWRPELGTPR
jgi:hypothetical protein